MKYCKRYYKGLGDNKSNYTVYIHVSPSGKKYIGITSLEPKNRWSNGKGYKSNENFTNAINKYGWENFEHIIIATNLSEEQAKEMEIELIAKYDSTNRDKGYNISLGGNVPSEETRKKLSETNKGKNASNTRLVIAIINDKIFATFDYIKQGAEYFNCNRSSIGQCCKGKAKSCGKYNGYKIVWRYITIIEL